MAKSRLAQPTSWRNRGWRNLLRSEIEVGATYASPPPLGEGCQIDASLTSPPVVNTSQPWLAQRAPLVVFVDFSGTLLHGTDIACWTRMAGAKRFVYVLKNQSAPPRYYTGLTSDVGVRLAAHNSGGCPYTAGGGPWNIDVVIEFTDEKRAAGFERYLKSGSGVAFAHRHLR